MARWIENSASPTGDSCPFASYVQLTPPGSRGGLVVLSQIDACGGNSIVSPVEPNSFGC